MAKKVGHLEKQDLNELTRDINDDWNNFVVSEIRPRCEIKRPPT